ncbi:MAG: oligosaccharide flippase family protein [Actinomycetota bacterium]
MDDPTRDPDGSSSAPVDEPIDPVVPLSVTDLFRRLLMQSGWLLSGASIGLALTFVQGIIVARLLGPSDLGVLAVIVTFVMVVGQVADSRAWESAIRYVAEFRSKGDFQRATAMVRLSLSVDTATAFLAFVIVLVFAGLAVRVFLDDAVEPGLVRLYAVTLLVLIPIGTGSALVRLAGRVRWLGYQSVVQSSVRLIGVIIVAVAGGGLPGVLIAYICSSLAASVVVVAMAVKTWPELGLGRLLSSRIADLRGHRRRIGRFLAVTNASALFKLAQRNVDVLLVGAQLGTAPVGLLRVARSTTDLIGFPVGPVYTSMYPEFVHLWHADKKADLRRLAERVSGLLTIVAVLGVLVVFVLGEPLLRLTVGEQFLGALPTMRWLAVGVGIAVATNAVHPVLLAANRAGTSLLATGFATTVQMVVLVLLIGSFGVEAAGIAYTAFYAAWVMIAIPAAWKELR